MAEATCNPQTILDSASCFACRSAGELEIIKTALLCQILQNLNPVASCDPNTLLANASCFACLPHGTLQIIQTQLLCDIASNGTGGGGGGATCGTIDPVAAPTGSCGIYYQLASGATPSSIWVWDSGLAAWVKVVA